MHFCKKSGLSLIVGTLIILAGCDTKREALGADNEIRVICSEIDKQIVRDYLTSIFTDTIYTPEPEPYYYLNEIRETLDINW